MAECGLKLLWTINATSGRAWGHDLGELSGEAMALLAAIAPGLDRHPFTRDDAWQFLVDCWSPDMRYQTTGRVAAPTAERIVAAARRLYQEIVASILLDDANRPW